MAGIKMKTMDEGTKPADASEETMPGKLTSGADKDTTPSRDGFVDATPGDSGTRGKWTFNFEFIVAALSFNVEFGIMFRLAYVTYRFSGVLFIGVYFIVLILFVVPVVYMELSLGQFFGTGPCHIWNFCPLFRGVGVSMVLSIAFITPLFGSSLSKMCFYFINSFSSVLPWARCDNSWNTQYCQNRLEGYVDNNTFSHVVSDPATEYYERRVLQLSSGIEHLGSPQWELVGCAFAVTILVFAALFFGIKVLGKVLCVMLLLMYVTVVVLLVRAMTLPGSMDGLKYFLYPSSFHKLLSPDIWMDAFMIGIHSSGASLGCIHTLASYKKFKSTALRDSFLVCVISAVTCFIIGILLFCCFGALAHLEGVSIEEIATPDPFSAIPRILAMLPVSQFWSALYFLMMMLSGLSAQIIGVEVLIAAVADFLPQRSRNTRFIITAVICGASFILSLPFLTKGGNYLFIVIDSHIALLAFHVLTILQCITVGWIYGIDQFSNDIQMMTGIRPPVIFKIIWCFILPVISLLSFGGLLIMYHPPTYGHYVFPVWSIVIGWMFSLAVLVPLPVFFILTLVKPGRRTLTYNSDFGPANPDYKSEYSRQREQHRTILDRLKAVFKT